MKDLIQNQRKRQIEWRKTNISSPEYGTQNKVEYAHIIPRKLWMENLWEGIRGQLPTYLGDDIKPHTGVHNLMSSWVVAANLYFPIRENRLLQDLMLRFLQERVSPDVLEITAVELEYALDGALSPASLLGETGGNRGSGQTSPDVAFEVRTKKGKGIILVECKFTEHSFYSCSARTTKARERRPENPDRLRCMVGSNQQNYPSICHQVVWGRKYWEHIQLSDYGRKVLTRCPAATGGYQLFRQQALANGLLTKGKFDMVASCVAFDRDNDSLGNSLKSTGVKEFETEWTKLFNDDVIFKTWHHQDWVAFVRNNQVGNEFNDWLKYLNDRYGY